jgi:hypothetical protein
MLYTAISYAEGGIVGLMLRGDLVAAAVAGTAAAALPVPLSNPSLGRGPIFHRTPRKHGTPYNQTRIPMMSETTLLESRVDKIERDNRRLKLTVGALLLVLAAVPLIGAVMPEQIQQVIQARAFHVVDQNGTQRAVMDEYAIVILDENDNVRAGMSEDGISYVDETGSEHAAMDDNGFYAYDEGGNFRAFMNASGIFYTDENETLRLGMNVDGIRYFDENGIEVWRTPER